MKNMPKGFGVASSNRRLVKRSFLSFDNGESFHLSNNVIDAGTNWVEFEFVEDTDKEKPWAHMLSDFTLLLAVLIETDNGKRFLIRAAIIERHHRSIPSSHAADFGVSQVKTIFKVIGDKWEVV